MSRKLSWEATRWAWYVAIVISLAGAAHWVGTAFGVNGLAHLFGDEPGLMRVGYGLVALAALAVMAGILNAPPRRRLP